METLPPGPFGGHSTTQAPSGARGRRLNWRATRAHREALRRCPGAWPKRWVAFYRGDDGREVPIGSFGSAVDEAEARLCAEYHLSAYRGEQARRHLERWVAGGKLVRPWSVQ